MSRKVFSSDSTEKHKDYSAQIARQQLKINELETRLRLLHAELNRQQGVKGQIKSLYRAIDHKIMRLINTRGYSINNDIPKIELPKVNYDQTSETELLNIAIRHDAQKYFRYQPIKPGMKLRYRVFGKFYRVTRGITKSTAKTGYRLAKK